MNKIDHLEARIHTNPALHATAVAALPLDPKTFTTTFAEPPRVVCTVAQSQPVIAGGDGEGGFITLTENVLKQLVADGVREAYQTVELTELTQVASSPAQEPLWRKVLSVKVVMGVGWVASLCALAATQTIPEWAGVSGTAGIVAAILGRAFVEGRVAGGTVPPPPPPSTQGA